MAIKDKQRVSENKLGNVISNDYRWTNIILSVIATISAAFSVLIIVGELTINDNVPVIGQFPVAFGWVLFARRNGTVSAYCISSLIADFK